METKTINKVKEWIERAEMGFFYEHPVQQDAAKALDQMAFPTTRDEAWKYTRTAKLAQCQFPLELAEVMADVTFEEFVPHLQSQGDFFGTLHTAFCNQAWKCEVKGNESDHTHHFVIKNNKKGIWMQPFWRIDVKENAKGKVVIHSELESDSFLNGRIEIHLAKGAHLDIDLIQDHSDNHFHLMNVHVTQEAGSHLNMVTHTLRGGWIRNEVKIELKGERAHAGVCGFYLPEHQQLIDNHTVVDHQVPNCTSNELYKGVLFDQSRGVFNGKVFVRKDAQKTEAYQSNKNIMMSDTAEMDSKPELEIYADDVRCSHGSTTGTFDQEALFYLRARGLSEMGAKQMLVSAYINEVIDQSGQPLVIDFVKNILSERGRIIAD